jgi:hypothetical protein
VDPLIKGFNFSSTESSLILIKIFIFVTTIVVIGTRGRFSIDMQNSGSSAMNMILALTYGVLSAGLIVSTILIYASGASLVQDTQFINEAVLNMYKQSSMVQLMVNNYNVWFSLPAITFVLSSFVGDDEGVISSH